MALSENLKEGENSFRDKITTVDEKGKRIWIYPKKPSGKFYSRRKIASYLLLVLLFGGPFVKIGGEPLLMLNVVTRKFVFFGQVFWPQDFYLAALTFIIFLVSIILFTVIFGRLFCGWVCPQTIFMEMIFRRIEYWIEGDANAQKKLNIARWNEEKIKKKTLKHFLFILISFLISNVFLAYIIGYEELFKIIQDDASAHKFGLLALLIFTFIFYGVFAFFREQVCTNVCPYGRLQGVLLDRDTFNVTYDYKRGEPREKLNEKLNQSLHKDAPPKSDCVDCSLCVQVCPTGIDIRNGTQLECVNCTACMDACDEVMLKIHRPKGLIRYASENSIDKGIPFKLSIRGKAYTALLLVLITVFSIIVANRSSVELNILRAYGTTFQVREDGSYLNIYKFRLLNKTNKKQNMTFKILNVPAKLEVVSGGNVAINPYQQKEGSLLISLDEKDLTGLKTELILGVYLDGELVKEEEVYFSGPFKFK